MHRTYSTITPGTVHTLTRGVLEKTLQFRPYEQSVTPQPLLDLRVSVAATARTLFAIASRYFDFSHETAR